MSQIPAVLRTVALAAPLILGTAPAAFASPGGVSLTTSVPAATTPPVSGAVATLMPDGTAAAPDSAPEPVKSAIQWANKIVGKPYRYGGGHARFNDTGYDCSGTISYALRGANALTAPLDSGSFMTWQQPGPGTWVTIYTKPSHAFIVIAGLRLDTSAAGDPGGKKGPRWRPVLRDTAGFTVRHPNSL